MPIFDPSPKYYRLSQALREQITSGDLPVNAQIPTEATLCETYQLSRGTVRKALDLLELEGLIYREQGKGVFVKDTQAGITQFSLVENRNFVTRTLTQSLVKADATSAHHLATEIDTPLIHIEQVQLEGDKPIIYEQRLLAQTLCPALLTEDLDAYSIHHLLIQKYQISLVRLTHTIDIQYPTQAIADLLHMTGHDKAFHIDRLTYTQQGDQILPAVWYRAVYRHDDYHFQAAFHASI